MGVKERAGLSGGSEDGDEMKARVLMFQGTGSDVGKSVTVADLVILPGSKSTIAA
jgi:cobyric acid synthase